ncbi:UBA domain-containing protein 7 [Cladorrhinum sp. PSN259]|nr:UBA domain-containing protein 7 [Cladorrhinum sp. PSN259]
MDDLSGLNWSAPNPAKKPTQSIPTIPATALYPSLRPTPSPLNSGRNTPLSTQGSGSAAFTAPAPASKPAADSFSNLLNFGAGKSNANLSLRERQEQIEAEKRKKEEERRKQAQAQFGDGRFLESLGQNNSGSLRTPSPSIAPPLVGFGSSSGFGLGSGAQNGKTIAGSDDDLFAAFKAETKVDNSSHFPPPTSSPAPRTASKGDLDLSNANAWGKPSNANNGGFGDDDDDPFGLNQLSQPRARAPQPPPPADDDDDLLGDLGKPVEQVRKKAAPTFSREPEPGKAIEDDSSSDSEPEQPPAGSDDPFDRAVAQLVDYGFSVEDARRGLTESGAGLDVQATVNWLLDDAHRKAKEQAKAKRRGGAGAQPSGNGERASSQSRSGVPAWIGPLPGDGSRGRNNQSPASADGDFAKTAAAVGTTFLKTANSLWKTGQKKVQQAVAEFQQEGGDPNQPKWMRSAQQERVGSDSRRQVPDVTDEALVLEGRGSLPARKPTSMGQASRTPSNAPSRERSPALPVRPAQSSQPKWQQQSQPALDSRARLAKQAEEENFQAYVSPSRRKKGTPQSQPAAPAQSEQDLLFGSSVAPTTSRATPTPPIRSAQPSPAPRPAVRQTPTPRPAPARPPRQIPHLSAIALQSSNKHRLEGTAHFKRGDYAAAHASYASSLSAIPQDHPLAILLLCNRALTALKTGEPRQAVSDADAAIKLIGEGKGEGEQVDVQVENGNTEKREMRELYGKALTRKAEALEQMEKWADALTVWQLCVQSNLGGATAAAGRQRCQKALAPKPVVRPAAARPAASRPKPTPTASGAQKSAEAVQRLRAANQAAAREGDEKIALTDKVDARIAAWRDGKRDNLRALLSSLDNVLWEGSGWKKVGLHELVMANKVKIVYMKAIAKTHPDKIAQDATTEVRMIAGTVFSTLNEAWDKFKAQNNL